MSDPITAEIEQMATVLAAEFGNLVVWGNRTVGCRAELR